MAEPDLPLGLSDIREIARTLERRKVVAIATTLIILAGALIYVRSLTPIYDASALVDVTPAASLPVTDRNVRGDIASDPVLIRTEIEVLLSDELARRVIDEFALDQDPAFAGGSPGTLSSIRASIAGLLGRGEEPSGEVDKQIALSNIVQKYKSQLSVFNDGRSTIATINFEARDPVTAAKIANAHARAYLKGRLERKLESTDVSTSKLISAAGISANAVYPKTGLFLLVSLAFATIAGGIAALVADRFTARAGDLHSLARSLGLSPIASVPLPKGKEKLASDLEALFKDRIRDIRNTVLKQANGQPTVVLVASSLPGEGKSLVSLALAKALARTYISTLLIDADLRNPSLAAMAGVKNEAPGLEKALTDEMDYKSVIRTGPFDLLPSFKVADPPVDMLVGDAVRRMLDDARTRYQVIIIDTPPIGAVSDCCFLAAIADQTLFLARGGSTRPQVLHAAVQKLLSFDANVTGLIFTGVDWSEHEMLRDGRIRDYYS